MHYITEAERFEGLQQKRAELLLLLFVTVGLSH